MPNFTQEAGGGSVNQGLCKAVAAGWETSTGSCKWKLRPEGCSQSLGLLNGLMPQETDTNN